jgi:hypothetical protein
LDFGQNAELGLSNVIIGGQRINHMTVMADRLVQSSPRSEPEPIPDVQPLQLAGAHLLFALRLLDRMGASVAGAHVDMALHELKCELELRRLGRELPDEASASRSALEELAIRSLNDAITLLSSPSSQEN